MILLLVACVSGIETTTEPGGYLLNNSSPDTFVFVKAFDVDEHLLAEDDIDLQPYATISVILPDEVWYLMLYNPDGEPFPFDVSDRDGLTIEGFS